MKPSRAPPAATVRPRPELVARARARIVVAVLLTCLWGLGGAMILLGTTGGLVSSSHAESQAPLLTSLGASDQASSADQDCLTCHEEPGLTMTLDSGEMISLYVDSDLLADSVHGDKLGCSDCHVRNQIYPHTPPNVYSARDFARAEYELCKRCHFENYTKTLDSIHYEQMAAGNAAAPLCTDCHTAHEVRRLEESRTQLVSTCATCHDGIYQQYGVSVHGSALREEDNPDVPDCITCHGVHDILSATTPSFHLGSLDLCADCHTNKELMDKYGISSDVLRTYLDDFHGKTVGFYQKQSSQAWIETPLCVDCHGVHDIRPADDPESSVFRENLLPTCQKCHPDATPNFPSAWLSHYEPSLSKAPIVFLVKEYYRYLIPIMVGGLMLHIMLDLWRLARNR